MPTTLTNGIQLPDKGSVDWYSSMQSNYNLIDTHLGNTDVHVTAEDKANWDSKADASHTHTSSELTDIGDYATKQYVDNSISDLVDNAPDALNTLNELSAALNDDSNFASTVTTALAAKVNNADLATVATSGSYNDLSNKPTINDSTITIQKNGSTVDTFTTNGSNKTINISVPTKTSDIINDSNFVDTSNSAVSSGITSAKVTDYDTHIADTDIHVTTADKTKWNNGVSQAYVLRYSSTAITDNSTIAYSTLDNTDNIKVSDKIIDSDGKIFSIVSIDSANETVTVGSALIDLALDANVMHLSGNETASGKKIFSEYITSDGSVAGDEYTSNTRTNLWLMGNRDVENVSGILFDTYRQNTAQGTGIHILGISIKENSVRYEGCRWGWYWDNNLNGYSFDFKPTTQGANQAVKHNLGTSIDKWDTINGINPGALSLPDLNNGIDISSYIDVSQTSQYTAPADGYISICGYATSTNAILIKDHDYDFAMAFRSLATRLGVTTYFVMPVIKNHVYDISCTAVTNIAYAKFFPCQGNV